MEEYYLELLASAFLLVFGGYFIFNYRRGIAQLGAFSKVRRDTDPVWFKIYVAINVIVLAALAGVLVLALVMRLS